jgi:hypothetical protein
MNSIRTPKRGRTASAARIAEAVDDQGWQEFRVSLKGKTTVKKLEELMYYYAASDHIYCRECETSGTDFDHTSQMCPHCDICIRVDNYIKALCRGGQLYAGTTLETFIGDHRPGGYRFTDPTFIKK